MKYIIFFTLALISAPSFGDVRVTYGGSTFSGKNIPTSWQVVALDSTTFTASGMPPSPSSNDIDRCFSAFAGTSLGVTNLSVVYRPRPGSNNGCLAEGYGWSPARDFADVAPSQLITTSVDITSAVNRCRTKCTISIPIRLQTSINGVSAFIDGTVFHNLNVDRDAEISLRFEPETISARPGGVARTTLIVEHESGVESPVDHEVVANGDMIMQIRNTVASNIGSGQTINLEKDKPVTVTTTTSSGTSSRHTIDFRLPKNAGSVGPSTYTVRFTSKFR